jgi:hypothetical protein
MLAIPWVSLRFAPCIASRLGRPSPSISMIQRTRVFAGVSFSGKLTQVNGWQPGSKS